MSEGRIIESGIGQDGRLPIERARTEGCRHTGGFTVDPRNGIVKCQACKEHVEPFLALSTIANNWARWRDQIDRCRREATRLRAVLEDLQREERNMRQRLRRLEKKHREGRAHG